MESKVPSIVAFESVTHHSVEVVGQTLELPATVDPSSVFVKSINNTPDFSITGIRSENGAPMIGDTVEVTLHDNSTVFGVFLGTTDSYQINIATPQQQAVTIYKPKTVISQLPNPVLEVQSKEKCIATFLSRSITWTPTLRVVTSKDGSIQYIGLNALISNIGIKTPVTLTLAIGGTHNYSHGSEMKLMARANESLALDDVPRGKSDDTVKRYEMGTRTIPVSQNGYTSLMIQNVQTLIQSKRLFVSDVGVDGLCKCLLEFLAPFELPSTKASVFASNDSNLTHIATTTINAVSEGGKTFLWLGPSSRIHCQYKQNTEENEEDDEEESKRKTRITNCVVRAKIVNKLGHPATVVIRKYIGTDLIAYDSHEMKVTTVQGYAWFMFDVPPSDKDSPDIQFSYTRTSK